MTLHSVGMEAKEQYAVGQTAEPKRDMVVIIKSNLFIKSLL